MTSPMQRHMEKVRTEQKAAGVKARLDNGSAKAIEKTATDYSEFEVLKSSLDQDIKAMGGFPKGQERNKFRLETLLPRYMPHVEAYRDSGEEYANPVLVAVVMWLVDLGRIGDAMEWALLAIEQKQQMPGNFNRNFETFFADGVLAWAEKEYKAKNSPEPYLTSVFESLSDWSVPDVVKMKYNKLLGTILFNEKKYEECAPFLQMADSLGDSSNPAKVGTKLDKALKEIEKAKKEQGENENAA